jgi:lysophospholipase L1-like esterase
MQSLGSASLRIALCGVAASAAFASQPAANAQLSYVVLGDSYAYGYTTPTGTSSGNGDPTGGYFVQFQTYLAATTGKTVTVTNLAEPGETSVSLSNGPLPSPNLNTNYNGSPATSQSQLAQSTLNASTNYVTLQIGGNDGVNYLYQTIYQFHTTPDTSITSPVLVQAANNVGTALQAIKTLAPNAQVYLINYADAFVALSSNLNPTASGLQGFDVPASQSLNTLLAQKAQASGVRYVDIAQAFSTDMASPNYIGNFFSINDPTANTNVGGINVPDFHPNAAGYTKIAQQLENAAAPEPGSAVLGLLGAVLSGASFVRHQLRRR